VAHSDNKLEVGAEVALTIRGTVTGYDPKTNVYIIQRDKCGENIYYSPGEDGELKRI